MYLSSSPPQMSEILKKNYPEVIASMRLAFENDFLVSSRNITTFNNNHWDSISLITFIRLDKTGSNESLEKKFPEFIINYLGKRWSETFDFYLQPITSIHLHSDREQEYSTTRDIKQIYLLSIIAFLILIVACINFMNLFTARYTYRSKEIGMRKVSGAYRLQLMLHLYTESILLAFISPIIAICLTEIIKPLFNNFVEKELTINYTKNIFGLIGLTFFVGILSDSYSAFYLSSFHHATALENILKKDSFGSHIKKGFVIFQRAMIIAIFISVEIIYKQMNYIKNKRLGFNNEKILSVRIRNPKPLERCESIKSELLKHSAIEKISASSSLLSQYTSCCRYRPERFYDDNLYRSEERPGSIFSYFAILVNIIACLGLLGHAPFLSEQRVKEIVIREVCGASVSNLFLFPTKNFTKWVLLANIIAWPIANHAMNKWLQNFVYRVNIHLGTFVMAAILALIIALSTVCYQTIKADFTSPIEALRYELA